jgi:hypothetical protein
MFSNPYQKFNNRNSTVNPLAKKIRETINIEPQTLSQSNKINTKKKNIKLEEKG